jgi:hypothetical protein
MDIGDEKPAIIVEPIEDPFRRQHPIAEPDPAREPEPVPDPEVPARTSVSPS